MASSFTSRFFPGKGAAAPPLPDLLALKPLRPGRPSPGALRRVLHDVVLESAGSVLGALLSLLCVARCFTGNALVAAMVAAVLCALVLGALRCFARRSVDVVVALGLVAIGALAFVFSQTMRVQLLMGADCVVYAANEVLGWYLPLFTGSASEVSSVPFAAMFGILAAVVAWALHRVRGEIAATVFFTLLFALLVCVLGLGWPLSALVIWAAGTTVALKLSLAATAPSLGRTLASVALAAVLSAALFVLAGALPQTAQFAQVGQGAAQGLDQVRYGSDSLPQGNLSEASGMNNLDSAPLSVSSSSNEESLYLPGFTGATLSGNQWSALDHTAYEGDWFGIMSWLESQGFDPQTQYATYNTLSQDQQTSSVAPAITVEAQGADRHYTYAPFNMVQQSQASITGRDGSRLSAGMLGLGTNRVALANAGMADALEPAAAWVSSPQTEEQESYLQAESVYRSFVQAHYLGLSDNQRALVERLFYSDETWDQSLSSESSVVSRVRVMLRTLASYSEDAASAPAGSDEVEWFLEQSRSGNSALFASAAVLAFRDQNIPARYVEGYLVQSDDWQESSQEDRGGYQATALSAHAWVEIYREGVGWVPVEVTPGFYSDPVEVGTIIDVSSVQGVSQGDENTDQAIGGEVEKNEHQPDLPQRQSWVFALVNVLVALLLLALLIVLVLEVRRALLLRSIRQGLASQSQAQVVATRFAMLSAICKAAGCPFDEAHPLEAAPGIAATFSGMREAEVRRAVGLMQKSYFGGATLAPHEMRVISRVVERLYENVPPAQGLLQRLKRRWVLCV